MLFEHQSVLAVVVDRIKSNPLIRSESLIEKPSEVRACGWWIGRFGHRLIQPSGDDVALFECSHSDHGGDCAGHIIRRVLDAIDAQL
jgi:hypothetical protein